jgi:coproporphyrinogen III oxidase-like Fe-S oxidoreductase
MYIIEPILNRVLRRSMRSVLRFDDAAGRPVPRAPAGQQRCLLYVHIPFCESLCPYCSFHRFVFEEQLAQSYFDALMREIEMYRDLGYCFTGMYVGGGTPTIMPEPLLELVRFARKELGVKEISVETNPNHVTPAYLDPLSRAGINRLSVGVQSFDDTILRAIGRYEKYGSGQETFERLQQASGMFDTLNIDLIFNMPLQSKESLKNDLELIDRLTADQVTFYPLMTAPSVADRLAATLGPIDYKQEKRMYLQIIDHMRRNYQSSTAWCFSRQKAMIDEYIIDYDSYVGVGSGAFGYFNNCIYINTFNLNEYIERVRGGRLATGLVKQFTRRETLHYLLLMKLFATELPKTFFETGQGQDFKKSLWPEMALLRLCGALREESDRLVLTEQGRYFWVMAMREFFIAVDTMRDVCRRQAGVGD